jgi:hypothetical protein
LLKATAISRALPSSAPDAEHGDHSLDVVGQHVQRHLAADVLQPARQEMGAAHPRLDRAERVFDGAAAEGHVVRVAPQTAVHLVDQISTLLGRDPTLVAGRAIDPEWAGLASVDPASPDRDSAFLGRVAVGQMFARSADIDIPAGVVDEVRLEIHALGPIAQGRR